MRYFNRTLLLACAAPAAFFCTGAFAQQKPPQDQASALEEVVVTAQRREEKLQNVPIPVSVFTAKDLEERKIQDVGDLGNGLPNVRIQSQQFGQPGTPYITIRGVTNTAVGLSQDSPVGLYLDGVYLGIAVGDAFEVADLQQVEVLRGPQGTLFGRNTVAGAISLTTKGPTGELDAHLETSYGNYDYKHVKLALDLPEWNGFSVRATGLHNDRDGYAKNLAPVRQITFPYPFGTYTTQSDFGSVDTSGASLAVRYAGIDDLTVDYKFDYTDSHDGNLPIQVLGFASGGLESVIQGIILKPPAGSITVPIPSINGGGYLSNLADFATSAGSNMVFGHSLTAQYDLSDSLSVKNIAAYRQQRFDAGIEQNGGAEAIATSPTGIPGFTKGAAGGIYCFTICSLQRRALHQVSEELQLIGHQDLIDWITGFYYYDQSGTQDNPAILTGVINNTNATFPAGLLGNGYTVGGGINTIDSESLAFYAHATVHVNDFIDIAGGARYTEDNRSFQGYSTSSPQALTGVGPLVPLTPISKSFSNADYDASVTWKVIDNVNIFGKISTSYLAGGVLNGNAFTPEFVTNYEAGLKSEWFDHRLRFNLDYSHRAQKDNQTQFLYTGQPTAPVPAGTPFGTVILNCPTCTYHFNSLELETAVTPLQGMTLAVNAGFQSAPTVAGVAATRPSVNLGVNASYDFPKFDNGMFVSYRLDGSYVGEHSTGLSATLLAVASPALLSVVNAKAVFELDMRLSLVDIPLGPVTAKAALWAKNITDQHTLNTVQDFGTNIVGTYDLPRMYGADLSFDFGGPTRQAETATADYSPPAVVAAAPTLPKSYLVFFDFNKSDLTPQAVAIVDQAARNAGPAKVTKLEVTGHTDTVGSDAYNMRLSRRRAESVAAQLENDGVPSGEIEIVAKGKRDLLVPTADGVKEPQNRRVQIVYEGGPMS